jgi:hypothetical protein
MDDPNQGWREIRMSALLERPDIREKHTPRQARARLARPATKAQIQIRARIIRKAGPSVGSIIFTKCLVFGVIMGASYTASSFFGQVLLEGARQQKMQAIARAHEAKQAEQVLTARLNQVMSIEGIEAWALAHGFQAPDAQRGSKVVGLVARR